ncbi:Alpha/Beta hydrolase protein [Tricladium varicosporioides]|nr:Alpha/Beta hydrolase protein [Hymenoscyphus varicosporioides]
MSDSQLFFKEVNPGATRTLLLIHGAISSHHEWDLVIECLPPSFHLLIPDLPCHGRSTSATIPLTLGSTAMLLKDLITKHAKNGKADVVGMSLGGYTAIYLAQRYPEVVNDLFVSGVGQPWPKPGTWMSSVYGSILALSSWGTTRLSKRAFDWLSSKADMKVNQQLYEDMALRAGYELGATVSSYLGEDEEENWKTRCERVKSRTCVCTAALGDPIEGGKMRGVELRVGNDRSRAFKVEEMRHAWDLQNPELFAAGIVAWLTGEDLPLGYVPFPI